MRTELVSIDSIVKDPDLQPRQVIRQSLVTDYAEDMQRGAQFPPILVFRKDNRFWLADGWHRIEAAHLLGQTEILAEIREGNRRDALLVSCSVNATHGLRRTVIDKRRAVTVLLRDPEWSQWSSRQIAKWCHVSHTFVDNMRAELMQESSTKREYVTRHGSRATMNTQKIGKSHQYHAKRKDSTNHTEVLQEYVRRLLALLMELEWSYDYYGEACCPVCHKRRFPNGEHEPDCELDALLKESIPLS